MPLIAIMHSKGMLLVTPASMHNPEHEQRPYTSPHISLLPNGPTLFQKPHHKQQRLGNTERYLTSVNDRNVVYCASNAECVRTLNMCLYVTKL